MIAYDPTEARIGTRLPQTVIDAGTALTKLEQYTGADLLLSSLKIPVRELDGSKPSLLLLEKHIRAGILIQRKSGLDFTASISRLAAIQYRMQNPNDLALKYLPLHELMIVADLKADRDGQAIIDGKASGFTWASVEGAILYWQLRGGMVSVLSRDTLVTAHINGWLERLTRLHDNPEYMITSNTPHQALLNGQAEWLMTLATFPGIGWDRAEKIGEYCGSLARSLEWLGYQGSVKDIKGIGVKTRDAARNYLGLRADESFQVIGADNDTDQSE